MPPPLAQLFALVYEARKYNEDVYLWPGVIWDLEYIHEEVSEIARGVQRLYAPGHARNSPLKAGMSLSDYLQLEWGQALLMLLTLGLELQHEVQFDPDVALDMAIAKIYTVAERKRREPKDE